MYAFTVSTTLTMTPGPTNIQLHQQMQPVEIIMESFTFGTPVGILKLLIHTLLMEVFFLLFLQQQV